MLKTIDISANNLDQAAALLDKGFPTHGVEFWQSMLAQIRQMNERHGVQSLGDLLICDDRPVGVLLKIHHHSPLIERPIVNLSSWYVEPEFRYYAPRMLLKSTSVKSVIYTDFSPSPDVFALNEKLGFDTISTRRLLFATPLMALGPSPEAKLIHADRFSGLSLSPDLKKLLAAHINTGCEALIIDDGESLQPVIFQIRKFKWFRCANLIFTKDLQKLEEHVPAISRQLLKKGILLITMPAPESQRMKGSFLLKRSRRHQVKGAWPQHMVDQTYSEAVLLPYLI